MTSLLLLNAATTWLMVGIIWMAQLVHYPLMAHTGPSHSASYQQLHVQKMALLVIPIMITEAAAAVSLCVLNPSPTAWIALSLLALGWTVTAVLSMPAHDKLQVGYSASAHHTLLISNQIRSVLWGLRGLLTVQMVIH